MARIWRSAVTAMGLGLLLIACHSMPNSASPASSVTRSVNDISISLTFHVAPGTSHNEFINKRVRRANEALSGTGLHIVDINIVYDLDVTFITWDSNTGDTGFTISKLESTIQGQTESLHIFIVDDIIDVADNFSTRTVGFYHSASICTKSLYLTPSAELVTLAHEIAHFYGLDHVNDIHNIMHAPLNNRLATAGFSSQQLNIMLRSAKKYERNCVDRL